MIETDKQRRWWFATHPEYSRSATEGRGSEHKEHKETKEKSVDSEKVPPEQIDAYVDKILEHETGALADFLRSVKRRLGTESVEEEPDQKAGWITLAKGPGGGGARGGGRRGGGRRRTIIRRKTTDPLRDPAFEGEADTLYRNTIEEELELAGVRRHDYRLTSFDKKVVAERDNIFNPHQRDPQGRTNLERMKSGKAPLDREGKPVQLHHSNQKEAGPIIEVTRTEHNKIPVSRRSSEINRPQFGGYRERHWKDRAERLEKK